ncbi:uncharacterized protein METZ01_LOCUS241481, partial [marine metagenome]
MIAKLMTQAAYGSVNRTIEWLYPSTV